MKTWRAEQPIAAATCGPSPALIEAAGETLVIQPLPGIGDMVWHLPHIHAIAAASAGGAITLLTKRRSAAQQLLTADPAVRRILWVERNRGRHDGILGLLRLADELRPYRFARAFILHGSARYALACLLAGIAQRIGYGRGLQAPLLDKRYRLLAGQRRGHPITLADRLLDQAGIAPVEREPRLVVAETARAAIGRRYGHLPAPWIAFGIGCSEPNRRWPKERFAELAARLQRQRPCTIFALGGQAEAEMAAWMAAQAQSVGGGLEPVIALPIDEVAALLERCAFYVGNDTGVFNLAAAVGTPAIGLFTGDYPPLAYAKSISSLLPEPAGSGMVGIGVAAVLARIRELGLA
jgi:heptosyltransferase-2